MAFSSSISSTNGNTSENVPIPFISDQTTLDTSSHPRLNIDSNVQYNVTMIAVNAIGASQPSSPILFTKTPGMCVCMHFITVVIAGTEPETHIPRPCTMLESKYG